MNEQFVRQHLLMRLTFRQVWAKCASQNWIRLSVTCCTKSDSTLCNMLDKIGRDFGKD